MHPTMFTELDCEGFICKSGVILFDSRGLVSKTPTNHHLPQVVYLPTGSSTPLRKLACFLTIL